MNKKIKVLVAIGGTGGHVFPGFHLANHLTENNYSVKLITDKRGNKFLKKFKTDNVYILPSSPIDHKNFFMIFYSFIKIIYSILRSLIFLIFNRPKIIFGMGGYASFPICFAAFMLKIKFIIYENNLIIGKANKYLLPFAYKIFVSYNELEGIPKKYNYKIVQIGNIIKKDIINFIKKNDTQRLDKIKILVLGGSQAAKVFAEILPEIFDKCTKNNIPIEVYQHCLALQNEKLISFYKNLKIVFEIFNFADNLDYYFSKADLAITRSGSSMLAELTNANIPFISIPLPSSADNHQFKNAVFYQKKNYSFLIEEKDLKDKLFNKIKEFYHKNYILDKIRDSQRQYSDKNVYNNIDNVLKKILNEKN